MTRKVVAALAALVIFAGIAFFTVVAPIVDSRLNTLVLKPPYVVPESVRAVHARLRIADMHDDLLLWPRDPLRRSRQGSTDIPRLIDGNVAVQIFSTVSQTPRGQNYASNTASSDNITPLAAAERRPFDNWLTGAHLLARVRWTSQKLHRAEEQSGGRLVLVTNAPDLQRALTVRTGNPRMVIGILSVEGLQVLEGKVANLRTLYALGVRMAGLAHFFDNDIAGSAHGEAKSGLTPLGREVVSDMERHGIIVDLAHVSAAAVDDVLLMATRPVVVSHSGVVATCPGPRNWTDDQLRRLAANGGVIGIGYWDGAVCDASPAGIARAIRHAVDVAGVDHVGLGSDWDGSTNAVFDASGLPLLTQALMGQGFTPDEIAKVMGENVIRLLLAELPPG